MKKLVVSLVTIVLLTTALTAMAASDIKVFVDQKQIQFDVKPVIEQSRVLIPARAVFEAMGANVMYYPGTKTVVLTKGTQSIVITINASKALVGDKSMSLDVPAKIIRGRTLVPLRFIAEALGAEVSWDGSTRTVLVKSVPEKPANNVTITIKNYSFSPAAVTIEKGDSITWVNLDSVSHTATGSGFDSGNLALNATYKFVFLEKGSYNYICSYHPSMKGTVTVK